MTNPIKDALANLSGPVVTASELAAAAADIAAAQKSLHVIAIDMAEDAYLGDAIATLALDGAWLTQTPIAVQAPHAPGTQQTFTFDVAMMPGPHMITVGFTNDAWGGGAALDRNLYVLGIRVDGVSQLSRPAPMFTTSTRDFAITVPDPAAPAPATQAPAPAPVAPAPTAPAPAPAPAPAAPPAPVKANLPAQPINPAFTVMEVGPSKAYPNLSDAGAVMGAAWNNGTGAPWDRAGLQGYHLIVSPGPDGWYDDDTGYHSKRWVGSSHAIPWPPFDGNLFGPVIIEGEPGKPAPLLRCPTGGAGALYYQQGWFNTFGCDATFRRLRFQGCAAGAASGGIGTMSALRFNTNGGDNVCWPGNPVITVEDVEVFGCDDGILGGSPGQTVILRRVHLHDNGNAGGRVHNAYIGAADLLIVEDLLSTNCTIGHLLKSRAAATQFHGSIRLIGNGGSESACLDLPSGGNVLVTADCAMVMQKSPNADAAWCLHFAGENHDADGGVPYHGPDASSIAVLGSLIMVAPPSLTGRQAATAPMGFANQTGSGISGAADTRVVVPTVTGPVSMFGIRPDLVGLAPFATLAAAPTFDLTPPSVLT